ncbi:MAG: signal peptidase I [Nocardioides sp.]|nr:signal peptidase I [Nocardioides sp.]
MTSKDRDRSVRLDPEMTEGSRSSSAVAAADKGEKKHLNAWQEGIVLVILAVVVAVIVKSFFVQAFYIPSESMEPGLQGGASVPADDRVVVEKPSYWFSGTPQRGDIVVFADPGGWLSASESAGPTSVVAKALAAIGLYPESDHLVKRVIGVAGDKIVCCDTQGRIEVNGVPITEPYARPSDTKCGRLAKAGKCYGPMPGTKHWEVGPVPKGQLFVMGDNRGNSADSTVHMCTDDQTDCSNVPWVPEHNVVGRVVALAWPLGRAKWIHNPQSFKGVPSK